ncbi:hypothetical protein FACS1894122_09510 [Alphaproteobacteria bacterium]|nr:hypothetical protein FACS1894122_09510 [Alphaproteobacteria bacterium]
MKKILLIGLLAIFAQDHCDAMSFVGRASSTKVKANVVQLQQKVDKVLADQLQKANAKVVRLRKKMKKAPVGLPQKKRYKTQLQKAKAEVVQLQEKMDKKVTKWQRKKDRALAIRLQKKETRRLQEKKDRALAIQLQKEEIDKARLHKVNGKRIKPASNPPKSEFINVVNGPRLLVKKVPGDGNCALTALGLTRKNLADFLSDVVNSKDKRLKEARYSLIDGFNGTLLLCRANAAFEEEGVKWRAAAKAANAGANASNINKVNFFIDNYIRREPADFRKTFGRKSNWLDIGFLGPIVASALGKNVHVVHEAEGRVDDFWNHGAENMWHLSAANNSGLLKHKLKSSINEKDIYPIYVNGNHFNRGIPVQ